MNYLCAQATTPTHTLWSGQLDPIGTVIKAGLISLLLFTGPAKGHRLGDFLA